MKLISAPGSFEMQRATTNSYVIKIVNGLFQVRETSFFRVVAIFLRNHNSDCPPSSSQLETLRISGSQKHFNARGYLDISPYTEEITTNLEALYRQTNKRAIDFQRGAIVELLAYKLINPRCKSGECWNNQIFKHERYESSQIDVVVVSEARNQIEAYTCKAKHDKLEADDFLNLTQLADHTNTLDYKTHLGAICLENSRKIALRIEDRLRDMPPLTSIYSYGLDNMLELEQSPF